MIEFLVEEGVEAPKRQTDGSSGLDVTAVRVLAVYKGDREIEPEKLLKVQEGFERTGYIKLRSLERILFGTGIKANMQKGTEIQVRPRSGMTLKRGLAVLNSPGTVDSDYREEIGVILYNSTPFLNKVIKGERIAQLCLNIVPDFEIVISPDRVLEQTTERNSGFGSTN